MKLKPNKMYKDREFSGKTFTLQDYYRGEHGEIRAKSPKLHLSKKCRRRLTAKAREVAAKEKVK